MFCVLRSLVRFVEYDYCGKSLALSWKVISGWIRMRWSEEVPGELLRQD